MNFEHNNQTIARIKKQKAKFARASNRFILGNSTKFTLL